MGRKQYTEDFKVEAVRQATEAGHGFSMHAQAAAEKVTNYRPCAATPCGYDKGSIVNQRIRLSTPRVRRIQIVATD